MWKEGCILIKLSDKPIIGSVTRLTSEPLLVISASCVPDECRMPLDSDHSRKCYSRLSSCFVILSIKRDWNISNPKLEWYHTIKVRTDSLDTNDRMKRSSIFCKRQQILPLFIFSTNLNIYFLLTSWPIWLMTQILLILLFVTWEKGREKQSMFACSHDSLLSSWHTNLFFLSSPNSITNSLQPKKTASSMDPTTPN